MTNKEIFYSSILKAQENGYKSLLGAEYSYTDSYAGEIAIYNQYIFSHDFCKAFFGDGKVYPSGVDFGICFGACREDMEDKWIYRWEFHLQQMILEKEPLRYLEKFL